MIDTSSRVPETPVKVKLLNGPLHGLEAPLPDDGMLRLRDTNSGKVYVYRLSNFATYERTEE